MPIVGRTPEDCFEPFKKHVAEVVAATLTPTHPVLYQSVGSRKILAFHQGDPTTVPIETRVGRLHFYLGQMLEAVKESRRSYRLRTHKYWYRLQASSQLGEQALLRWEYDFEHERNEARPCRHHIQLKAKIDGLDGLDLNRVHVPTGWVTFEEVIRFLIVELEVQPPCGAEWPQKLAQSEKLFFEEFTSKRYKPPAPQR